MARALQQYEDSLGPHGYPLELEEDSDQDGYFEVVPSINYATRALDIYRSNQKRVEPGEVLRVVYKREDNDGE